MSDQADGLRELVKARSGTIAFTGNDPPGRDPLSKSQTLSMAEPRDVTRREPPGFFAALAARWTPRRLAR